MAAAAAPALHTRLCLALVGAVGAVVVVVNRRLLVWLA